MWIKYTDFVLNHDFCQAGITVSLALLMMVPTAQSVYEYISKLLKALTMLNNITPLKINCTVSCISFNLENISVQLNSPSLVGFPLVLGKHDAVNKTKGSTISTRRNHHVWHIIISSKTIEDYYKRTFYKKKYTTLHLHDVYAVRRISTTLNQLGVFNSTNEQNVNTFE